MKERPIKKKLKKIIKPHLKKWLKDVVRINNKLEQTDFVISNFFSEDKNLYLLKFYQGEIYRSKKDEENNKKAIRFYQESIELKKDFADSYRELGLLLLKDKKIIEAKKNLQKYVDLEPNAKDVEIVKSYLN